MTEKKNAPKWKNTMKSTLKSTVNYISLIIFSSVSKKICSHLNYFDFCFIFFLFTHRYENVSPCANVWSFVEFYLKFFFSTNKSIELISQSYIYILCNFSFSLGNEQGKGSGLTLKNNNEGKTNV